MADLNGDESERVRPGFFAHLGFGLLFLLGILHVLKVITIDWVGLAVFTIALIPSIAQFLESFKLSKDGIEAKTRSIAGPVRIPQTPPRLAGQGRLQVAAAPESEFTKLAESEKKILATLWPHQQEYTGPAGTRWGFKVGPRSLEFIDFGVGRDILMSKGLVGIGPKRGLVYLTDEGVKFCKAFSDEVATYPHIYEHFEPL